MTHASRLGTILAVAASLGGPALAQELTAGDVLAGNDYHGLAFDPADPTQLLLATHRGLFAISLMTRRAQDVSEMPADYMGFVADPASPGSFLSSGHLATGGNLGVVGSSDGGATWAKLSDGVGGPVDFHQMDISKADPQRVWGVSMGGGLQASGDKGLSWEAVGPAPEGLIDIAGSARDARTLFAATTEGLLVSRDGGASWASAYPAGSPVSVVDVGADGRVLAFVVGKGLIAASEDGLTWEQVGDPSQIAVPLALAQDPANDRRLAVVTNDGRLLVSATGGETWTLLSAPAT